MEYKKYTYLSKNIIQRFSHENRFKNTLELINPKEGESILDYGCGDAHIWTLINNIQDKSSYTGFDVSDDMLEQARHKVNEIPNTTLTNNLKLITNSQFDKAICIETLEHINEDLHSEILDHLHSSLRPGGTLLVSVPIEHGLTSLLKNILRVKNKQKEPITNLKNILLSFFGLPFLVKRNPENLGHMGFDYRKVKRAILNSKFNNVEISYSPFKGLRQLFNSQIFFKCTKAEEDSLQILKAN